MNTQHAKDIRWHQRFKNFHRAFLLLREALEKDPAQLSQLEKEGKEILTAAAAHSPELKIAMETWKEIKFEFDTVDKLDISNK